MLSEPRAHIERIREEFQASQRVRDSLNNSIQALAQDLYSKETHFIFELIQNAEDNTYKEANPSISFRLVKFDPTDTQNSVGALIIQNNEVGFSPDNVEAICAVGKTTKSKLQGYIGEKGIGFKSVFRITTVPHIFSNGYQFCFPEKDETTGLGYIVPQWISKVPPQIDPKQTTIVLPLNKQDFSYEKVEVMLKDVKPETILFLSKLKEIQIKTDSGDNLTIQKIDSKTPQIQLSIEGTKQGKSYSDIRKFLLFTKTFCRPRDIGHEKRSGVDKRDVTIAFPIDDNKDSMGKIFAYLPVRSDTDFPFLINADFILPSSREDILDVAWNRWLMDCAANLLVEALPVLRKEGLLTIELLEMLAKRINELDESSIFYPIAETLHNAFMDEELLPANDGTFVSAKNANLAESDDLRKLLSPDQLKELFSIEEEVKWLSHKITGRKTPELWSYLTKNLDVKEITSNSFARKITKDFLKKQSTDWMTFFYQFLNNHEALWRRGTDFPYNPDGPLRNKPFIRLQNGAHVLPFKEDDTPNAYLPPEGDTLFPIVAREIAKDKKVLEFLQKLGLTPPDAVAEVIERILPKYREGNPCISDDEHTKDIEKILKSFKTDSQRKKRILLEKLKNTAFIKGQNIVSKQIEYKKPEQLYFKTKELDVYFDGNEHAWFVSDEYHDLSKNLFKDLGVENKPRFEKISIDLPYEEKSRLRKNQGHTYDIETIDYELDGLENFLMRFRSRDSRLFEDSLILWNFLLEHIKDGHYYSFYEGEYKWFYYHERSARFDASWKKQVVSCAWLPKEGDIRLYKPRELSPEELPDSFIREEKLCDLLGMRKDVIVKLAEEAGVSLDTINIARELENHPEFLKEFRKKIRVVTSDKEIMKKETDTDKICYKDELRKSFNRPGKTKLQEQPLDTGNVRNPDRRREKSYEEHKQRLVHEPNPDERRKKTIRTILEGPDEEVREYLSQFYNGKCQICGKTFPERNGKPFFIANYIVPKKLARFIDTPANALCLCADHFAKWHHGAVEAEDIIEQIQNFKTESEGGNCKPVLKIILCGEECKITFIEKHLLDLQELLRASEIGDDYQGLDGI